MTIDKKYFLAKLKEIIDVDFEVEFNMKFSEIENVDSLTYMTISAWISDKFEIKITVLEIEKMTTIEDLYNFLNN
jgi:acyl carrier protein